MSGEAHIAVVIISTIILVQYVEGMVQCYKCNMVPTFGAEPVRLCSEFDYSEKFIVTCNHSTLCLKKTYSVNLADPVNGTLRDCAPQRYDYQEYRDGKWQLQVAIEEPYEEGCMVTDDKGLRNSRTQYCYCRGDLCNGSTRLVGPTSVICSLLAALLYTTTL